ncbi:TetR/AcrR family transcriptional regulator [Paenibacillaceae bacterium WGS1546]|uniref:TetR/AcrR family transcriptional regulator n=1 Tax=Cohnella sp. WGS1546 TaxID=3366810 RepID=UPI00372CF565
MVTQALDEAKSTVQTRILNAAEVIFARIGFAGCRMNDIAAKAGVNQALIHYYFESKEKLYMEVVTRLFEQWELHVNEILLEDEEPQALLRKYIKEHFELKCKLPNLHMLYHRESLEGGDLFQKYASAKWTGDTEEKMRTLAEWKKEGLIQGQMHERVLLQLIWGMMNQFYYRSEDNLREEMQLQGSYEEMKELLADQIIRMTLYGVLPRDEDQDKAGGGAAVSRSACVLFPQEVRAKNAADIDELLNALRILHGMELRIAERAEELLEAMNADNPRLVVVLAATAFGEVPASVHELLSSLEAEPGAIADRFVALWTASERQAGEHLQRTLEETFNRFGAYAVSRVPGQNGREYAERCAKLARN